MISPFNAWLVARGLDPLCRFGWLQHCVTALAVAKFLESRPAVRFIGIQAWKVIPSMSGQSADEGRYSAMLAFGLHGGGNLPKLF